MQHFLPLTSWGRRAAAIVVLMVVGATLAAGVRWQRGDRQTVERLISMNASGYQISVSAFGPSQMEAAGLDGKSLFAQFVFELTKYAGPQRPGGVVIAKRNQKELPQLATISLSGPANVATPEVLERISTSVRDSIGARTRVALAAAKKQALAQIALHMDALRPVGPVPSTVGSIGQAPRTSRPPAETEMGPTADGRQFQGHSLSELAIPGQIAPGGGLPKADRIEQLVEMQRMLSALDTEKIDVPVFSVVQEQVYRPPIDKPAWMWAVVGAGLATMAGVWTMTFQRPPGDTGPQA